MLRYKIILFCFLIILSCNCQKRVKNGVEQVGTEFKSDRISSILQEKNFNILLNTESVIAYDIRKKLIEGTKDEYSNKLFLKDSLSQQKVAVLLGKLKNDQSYNWENDSEGEIFEPTNQYSLKSHIGRLTILFDSNHESLSFINLDGQKILSLTKDFSDFLKEL